MAIKLVWTPQAEEDLIAISSYIALEKSAAG